MEELSTTEIALPLLKCLYPDCGHEWHPRNPKKPKVCPECKRYNWDKSHPLKSRTKARKKSGGGNVKRRKSSPAIEAFKETHKR